MKEKRGQPRKKKRVKKWVVKEEKKRWKVIGTYEDD
jgi:hypothetical protein